MHALEQIHELLNPGGHLINIQPNGELVEFILPLEEGEQFIGYMLESDDYIEYRQSAEALESVIAADLFQELKSNQFEFLTHANSFNELKKHLEENWSDAVITDEVITNARKLEAKFGAYKPVLREQVSIRLLQNI